MPTTFRVLLYREDKCWIAHCLEMDLAAEGSTKAQALSNLVALVDVQIAGTTEVGDLQSIFSAAPPDLWRRYSIAQEPPRMMCRLPESTHAFDLSVREMA